MKKKISEKEKKIIIDFVNSDNFMLLNDYCTKSYEITINELQHRINKAIEYIGLNEEDLKQYDIYDVNGIELLKILKGDDNEKI